MNDNFAYLTLPVLTAGAWVLMYPDAPFATSALLGASFGGIASSVAYLLFAEMGPSDLVNEELVNLDVFLRHVEDARKPVVYAKKCVNGLFRLTYFNVYTENAEQDFVNTLALLPNKPDIVMVPL